jgi:hypothetical protein
MPSAPVDVFEGSNVVQGDPPPLQLATAARSTSVTAAPVVCVAAVEPSAPRVTVQVVVPAPSVTSRISLSTFTRNSALAGKPAAEATAIVVALAVRLPLTVELAAEAP